MSDRGLLFVLEGVDGSGKTTQAARLAEHLGAVLTREPGGTEIGERLRSVVLDPDLAGFDDRAEALVMAACRAQHVAEVIEPALVAGRHVVSDRYVAASLAYQGAGRGLGVDAVAAMNEFATGALRADLVILLDVGDDVARRRMVGEPDRLEAVGDDLQRRARDCYRELAATGSNWVVVDADASPDEVAARIADSVDGWLAERS